MNKQEAFDKVWNHFVVNKGKRSVKITRRPLSGSSDNVCQYRSPSGDMCAIGCLIPEDLYDPKMEGKDFLSLVTEFPKMAGLFLSSNENDQFFDNLQDLHDNKRKFDNIEESLRIFGRAHALKVPEV